MKTSTHKQQWHSPSPKLLQRLFYGFECSTSIIVYDATLSIHAQTTSVHGHHDYPQQDMDLYSSEDIF